MLTRRHSRDIPWTIVAPVMIDVMPMCVGLITIDIMPQIPLIA